MPEDLTGTKEEPLLCCNSKIDGPLETGEEVKQRTCLIPLCCSTNTPMPSLVFCSCYCGMMCPDLCRDGLVSAGLVSAGTAGVASFPLSFVSE